MLIDRLREKCIKYLLQRREIMIACVSNCADIDKKLKMLGYKDRRK